MVSALEAELAPRVRVHSAGRGWLRWALAIGGGLLIALALAPWTASAHAQLLTTTPVDGEVVGVAPVEVVLTFNEPVSLTGGDVRVLDDDAAVVSGAPVQADVTVTVPLPADTADGTYTVAWEVVSTDSHRIAGAFVFHVGAASSEGLDIASIGTGGGVGWGVRSGAALLSGVAYAAALVAIGVWCFTWAVLRPAAAGGRSTNLDSLIVRSAVLGAVTLVAAVPFRIARIGGGLDALNDNDILASALRGPIGQAVAVTALGLVAFAVTVERRAPLWMGAMTAVVALAGFSLEGHTRALNRRRLAMIGSDVVHLSAAAVWLGGIVALTLAFRSTVDAGRLAIVVRRFSNVALAAVAGVSASGVLMAWIVLPTAGELTSTGYGLALLLKVALVLVVLVLGAINRWLLVPVVVGRMAGATTAGHQIARSVGSAAAGVDDAAAGAKRRLSRIVLAELMVLLGVVATTAVLVTRSPVSSTSAAAAPTTAVVEVVGFELELSDGSGTVEVSLSPGRVGPNTVDLVLVDVEGRLVNPLDTPSVEFTQTALEIGPLRPDVGALNIGRYEATADLGVAGDWELVVRVRVSDFESATATGVVTIQ